MWTTVCCPWMTSSCDDGPSLAADTSVVSDIARHPNGLAAQRLIEVGVE